MAQLNDTQVQEFELMRLDQAVTFVLDEIFQHITWRMFDIEVSMTGDAATVFFAGGHVAAVRTGMANCMNTSHSIPNVNGVRYLDRTGQECITVELEPDAIDTGYYSLTLSRKSAEDAQSFVDEHFDGDVSLPS